MKRSPFESWAQGSVRHCIMPSCQPKRMEPKRMESDALHGTVVRRSARLWLTIPINEAIYAILRPWALQNSTN
jgi:ketopantoate reductase